MCNMAVRCNTRRTQRTCRSPRHRQWHHPRVVPVWSTISVAASLTRAAMKRSSSSCQSAAGSAPPIGGQSAPGLKVTIGSKHERIRFPQGAPVGGSRDRHRALAVGYRHFVSGAVTSSRRSIRVVRKLRPVIATTWASSASRSRAALPRSGSANNSCHSAGARLLVTAVLLRS